MATGALELQQVSVSQNKAYLMQRHWYDIYLVLGDSLFKLLLKEFLIFRQSTDDSLVQISGNNIFLYLSETFG